MMVGQCQFNSFKNKIIFSGCFIEKIDFPFPRKREASAKKRGIIKVVSKKVRENKIILIDLFFRKDDK